jgi:ribosomal protein S18 acetylase RimI-like enzyme
VAQLIVDSNDLEMMAGVWSRATLARNPEAPASDVPSVFKLLQDRSALPDAWFAASTIEQRIIAIVHGLPGRENDGAGNRIPGLMHVSMIAVDPESWGRGYGRTMTEFAIQRARQLGYERVQLWTQISNERAISLYESVGFRASGREDVYQGEPVRLYALSLKSLRDGR